MNIMKKLLFLMIAATAIAFVGCSKDDPAPDPVIEPALSVSLSSILATVVVSSYDIAVTSNVAWTATVNGEAAAWCTVSPANGNGDATVTVRVTESTATTTRTATITFTAGALTQQVSVTQAAATPVLDVDKTTIDATAAAATYSIGVTSNVAWTAAVDAGAAWCTVLSPANGTANGSVAVNVAENVAIETRAATVTFTAGALTQQVSVTQEAAVFYAASTQTWTFGQQIWSDAIHIPDCNKTTFPDSYTEPSCRSYKSGANTRYYYNWPYVVANASTLCPSPWRVPSHDDHVILADNTTDSELIREWGFGGLAYRSESNNYMIAVNTNALFWSSTENEDEHSIGVDYFEFSYALGYSSDWPDIDTSDTNKHYGLQMRCVK
jgi:hypothetical protein